MLLLNNSLIISQLIRSIKHNYFYNFFYLALCIIYLLMYNMLDGENLNIAGFNFFILLYLFYKTSFNLFFLIFFISNIFFAFQNYKNKTFFGNNGTLFFSFLISVILIYCFKNFNSINEEDVILLLIFPVTELLRLFFVRIYNNTSPFIGDKNHFHHLTTKIFGKFSGILLCQLFIISSIFIDFIFQINLWYIILIFLLLYSTAIRLMNNYIKKHNLTN